ncbi:hypothetical protein OROMI_032913 [Orobanche minor]
MEPQIIRQLFTGNILNLDHKRREFTEQEIRVFETYNKEQFPRNPNTIVMDLKAIRAARHKRNELALAELAAAAAAESLSAGSKADEEALLKSLRISTATVFLNYSFQSRLEQLLAEDLFVSTLKQLLTPLLVTTNDPLCWGGYKMCIYNRLFNAKPVVLSSLCT